MKRTIFLAAMTLMISAGINAQNNNQIQSQDQDRTRSKTNLQIQDQTAVQNQTQAMTKTQVQDQLRSQVHQQLRKNDRAGGQGMVRTRSQVSVHDNRQRMQARPSAFCEGSQRQLMLNNSMRTSGGNCTGRR
jgi:hypothetical protein